MEQITLYYKQGSSDKVYSASIQPEGIGYVINIAYGRRGSTQQTATKTPTPLSYEAARAIYDKLIKEKMAKGYTPGEDGTPYTQSDREDTGIRCQLLNAIDNDEIAELIADAQYWMQEKMDGKRLLIQMTGTSISGINRLGLKVSIPQTLHDDAANCPLDFIIDGEAIGDVLHVFDVLSIGRDDLRDHLYLERHLRLMNLLASFQHSYMKLVKTACIGVEKLQMFDSLKAQGREGVVFKRIDQPYTSGRPSSVGPALKFKFYETASFIVAKVNAKRSVSVSFANGASAGNVTISANREVPSVGAIVEVRYLYAFRETGHIYQPVYLGQREDITKEECTVEQLKYKS